MNKKDGFLTRNIIAHRGAHDFKNGIPENSLLAFVKAIENNYLIELDVHIIKDGHVVVFHDDNLKRMTGVDKKIRNSTYDELKNLTLARTEQKIPLLEDVLSLVDGRVPLIIELKTDVKCGALEKEVIKILSNYKGEYAVKSFNPFSVNYFRKYSPETIRGQLSSDYKNDKMCIFKKLFLGKMLFNFISKPDFISYDINAMPNRLIEKLRKNKVILGWTVRNKIDYEKAKKYCDNLICENVNDILKNVC